MKTRKKKKQRKLTKREKRHTVTGVATIKDNDIWTGIFEAVQNAAENQDPDLFNWTPNEFNAENPSLTDMRVMYTSTRQDIEYEKKSFSLKTEFGELTCEYATERVAASLARFFDPLLALPKEKLREKAEKNECEVDALDRHFALHYQADIEKSLEYAMNVFEGRFFQFLNQSWTEFCQEIVAETINAINTELFVSPKSPTTLYDHAIELARLHKTMRMRRPRGKPQHSGFFESDDDFKTQLNEAGYFLLWAKKSLTQPNIVEAFNILPQCLSLGQDDSGEVLLRNHLRRRRINWRDFKTSLSMPTEYTEWAEQNLAAYKNRI